MPGRTGEKAEAARLEAGPSGVDLLKMRCLWFRKASAASLILVVDPNSISLSASVFLCVVVSGPSHPGGLWSVHWSRAGPLECTREGPGQGTASPKLWRKRKSSGLEAGRGKFCLNWVYLLAA